MRQLLKHEFFKIGKSMGIKITFIITVVLFLLISLIFSILPSEVVMGSFTVEFMIGIFSSSATILLTMVAIAITMIIVGDYNKGVVRNMLLSGHSRFKVFTARWIGVIVVTFVFTISSLLIFMVIPTIRYKLYSTFVGINTLYEVLHLFFQMLAYGTFVMFVASGTRSIGGTIGIILGLLFFLNILGAMSIMFGNAREVVFWISKSYVGSLVSLVAGSTDLLGLGERVKEYDLIYFFIGLGNMILAYIFGLLQFKKSDLK